MSVSAAPSSGVASHSLRRRRIPDAAGFGLLELRNASPLVAQLLPTGALFALRHRETLLNQVLPGPEENGLFRLLVRWRAAAGRPGGWAPLAGPGQKFLPAPPAGAAWASAPAPGLQCRAELQLHPVHAAWAWRISLRNESATPLTVDVLHAQDLGLADEGAVRNNEAYTSHYLDFLPVRDAALGWTLLARQNQPMADGRHPWLALACAAGAAAFCTDGTQFFGADHRLTGEPAAVREPDLPSRRLQGEFALGGLQCRAVELPPGQGREVVFLARFVEDHPAASAPPDLDVIRALLPPDWLAAAPAPARWPAPPAPSLFLSAGWAHGARPSAADWQNWFPGERRHEERAADGALLAFFHGADTHVVARDKEAAIARPHGHILRSGGWRWIDGGQFGLTCYAAGIFAAQAYFGNPSFARLLSVARNALNVTRAGGQRVFVRRGGAWRQLGIPSAFALTPGDVRWIYRLDDGVVEARVWCSREQPASFLELRAVAGAPAEFLVTHQLALGAGEFEHAGEVEFMPGAGWLACRPGADSLMARHLPGAGFAIAAADPASLADLGGDELIYADGGRRGGPCAALRFGPALRCGVILLGARAPDSGNPIGYPNPDGELAAARAEFAGSASPARPPAPPVRLAGAGDPGVARVDEILPWFTHNAAIHFSAPHGLEQSGGAAWGVRDVCQGSLEWLLAAGEHATVRRMLLTVFAQQYPRDGSWPQWFMHAPFRAIQQAHSHGDVCFWPVKALCDYAEAADDTAFLATKAGYTDAQTFAPAGPEETLWAHCDRVIAHAESRFAAGTALVNYGDGDWDDTLQPADPAMRTRMISAWTVALAFQAFRQLAEVSRRAGETARAARLATLCARMRGDFAARLMPGGVVAGFIVNEPDGRARPLLHPDDKITGIRYRLLPMTRAILAGLFTPEEAARHLRLIADELLCPDGVRLMSAPAVYAGGVEKIFKRADTAANVGREIGLQYVHAHLRYAEALARVGDAEGLWRALQAANPVALAQTVPNATPRQSNVYFSSSDADFADRYEAAARWPEVRAGRVAVRGGWRLYSSGPGLFLHNVRGCLLGVRESFGELVIDPVLPRRLDGLVARVTLCGQPAEIHYQVRAGAHSPKAITLNGERLAGTPEANPYRAGGLRLAVAAVRPLLRAAHNRLEIEL